MALIEINWNPSRKDLRGFGNFALTVLTVVSSVLYCLKRLPLQWALTLFAIGFIIFVTSLVSTKLTRMVYLALTLLTSPIALAVSFILLAAFYFLLLTPLGLLFRLLRRDPLGRKFDPGAKTYWRCRKPPDDLDRYFRQF
jgi:hypothetical protein